MTNQTPSTLLSNRYQILSLLGDGGFGKTFLVEDTQIPSKRRCVVKQLKPIHDNPQVHQIVQDRFEREAAILERLGDGHEQIPRLYAYFSEGDQFYLVEEWVEGDTLTQKVQREGVQSEAMVRSMLMQLLPTIGYVHQQQIVHRDIKPDNIILRRRDGKPVLIDFGAVKESLTTIINSQGNSSHSIVVGTPGYMPAEQLAGRPVFASDIYGLGMTAIFMLTGRIPQQLDNNPLTGEINWQQYASWVSLEFAAILNRSIHMQPQYRYSSAQEMLAALQSPSAEVTLPPQSVTPLQSTILTPSSPPPIPQSPVPQPQTVPPSDLSTQAAFPQHTIAAQPVTAPPSAPNGDWKKAVVIGGIIGASILGGAVMLRSQIPGFLGSPNIAASVSPSPTPTVSPSQAASPEPPTGSASAPAPAPKPQIPSASGGTGTGPSNAVIIDKDSETNVRSGPGTNNPIEYIARSGDRVQILGNGKDGGGFTWYRVVFPKSGAEGWIAAQLLKLDATEPTKPEPQKPQDPKPEDPAPTDPTDTPSPSPQAEDTNATIVGASGSKNVRTGPGTNFPAQHIAYPGDRVQVRESSVDSGGFTWYKVYFPKSSAEGWVAAQLIKLD